FTRSEAGCLLGKAGRSRFYAEWEPVAARLRKQLTENVADVARTMRQVAGVSRATSADPDQAAPLLDTDTALGMPDDD
ncbi:MAG TPA: CRISPR-associated endonuclease Cas1, partial [Accumulibacter sp.]|nr:CRISPR-associated endonuclease Cas1 [Accumulibacter sp.]